MFIVDLTFILPKSNKEDEGVAILELEVQVAKNNRVPRVRFWHAPIDLDKGMEDVEKLVEQVPNWKTHDNRKFCLHCYRH